MEDANVEEAESALTTPATSTAAASAPRAKGKSLPNGWCDSEEVQRAINVALQNRGCPPCGGPEHVTFRKRLKAAVNHPHQPRGSAAGNFFEGNSSQLEKECREDD